MSRNPRIFDCQFAEERADGVRLATTALRDGRLVVLPTDTVYGVAADAFSPEAVAALLAAKRRGRDAPPPVLVGGVDLLPALASSVVPAVTALAEAFWPGALTLICWAQPSLSWDLGDTGGTVALRVPDHPVTLELLRACGPLAVSSANLSGRPPGDTAALVRQQLGDAVAVYLEDGPAPGGEASTIVDTTGDVPRVVRLGGVTLEQLRAVVPEVLGPDDPDPAAVDGAGDADDAGDAEEPGEGAAAPSDDVPGGDRAADDDTRSDPEPGPQPGPEPEPDAVDDVPVHDSATATAAAASRGAGSSSEVAEVGSSDDAVGSSSDGGAAGSPRERSGSSSGAGADGDGVETDGRTGRDP